MLENLSSIIFTIKFLFWLAIIALKVFTVCDLLAVSLVRKHSFLISYHLSIAVQSYMTFRSVWMGIDERGRYSKNIKFRIVVRKLSDISSFTKLL